MNTQSDLPPQNAQPAATTPNRETRPMYWSVRRELWENRSIYIAPLIVAAVVLFASSLGMIGLPRRMRALPTLDPVKGHDSVVRAFSIAPAPIMLAAFLVGVFYCLDALYGERRDRSILFWKSLPVSDRTTVLSKAAIPLVVLPLIAYALSVAAQLVLLPMGTMTLLGNGLSPVAWWGEIRFFQGLVIMLYGLTVHTLWFAPIYAWLLLVSAWAKRTPILWAALPPLAVAAVERIVFSTSSFMRMLGYRVTGAMIEAFDLQPTSGGNVDRLSEPDPVKFLSAPGLWVGLAFAAIFLVAAVRLRRNREPI